MTKTKIAHLILKLDIGGLERVMLNCIRQMQLANPEFEHVIISLTDANKFSQEALIEPVEVICMNKKEGNDWGLHIRLFKLFRTLNIGVLHSYNLSTIEYQFAAMLAGVKGRIHAEHGRDIGDPKGENKKHNFLRKLMSLCLQKYIAVSDELFHWLIDKVKVNSDKVLLIPNGINTETFNISKSAGDKVRFINVARLSPIKDHENLLAACELLSKNEAYSDAWQLTIVGDGPLMEQLKESISVKKLTKHVAMVGASDRIAEYLSRSDVFVLSSIAEGIPMTILEAMSAHTPVISTAVGGIPQVISDNVEGKLVVNRNAKALAQAMSEYLKDPHLVAIHGKAARTKVVEKFNEQKMVEAYIKSYQQVLGKGHS